MTWFVRIWEYEVMGNAVAAYGADGEWAQLFARGTGYLGAEPVPEHRCRGQLPYRGHLA